MSSITPLRLQTSKGGEECTKDDVMHRHNTAGERVRACSGVA